MEAGAFGLPVVDQLRFVSSVIVHDEVNVQFFRHVLLDGVEEVAELYGTMALLILADDFAGLGIQRSKQAGGAVPRIVVGAALDLPRPMGNSGAVRSSAWIWLFSSTHKTSARSGGFV
jgi:hypothetical protein